MAGLDDLVKNYDADHAKEVAEALGAVEASKDASKRRAQEDANVKAILEELIAAGPSPAFPNYQRAIKEIKEIYGIKEG